MTQLTKFFAELSIAEPAIWVALASALAVLLGFLFLARRQRRTVSVVGPAGSHEEPDSDAWVPPPKRPDERRRSTRRTGVPTPVKVADPKKSKRVLDGFVLDRSSGGVRLALDKPFPTGSTLQVRPSNAPDEMLPIVVIVRNCREVGDYFELGCQFQEELPWNVLLMFG